MVNLPLVGAVAGVFALLASPNSNGLAITFGLASLITAVWNIFYTRQNDWQKVQNGLALTVAGLVTMVAFLRWLGLMMGLQKMIELL